MVAKLNAYGVFVNDVFNRRRNKGEPVSRPSLFQELGPQWNSMSDEEKQPYKDRAKAGPNIKKEPGTGCKLSVSPVIVKQEVKPTIDQKVDLTRAVSLKRSRSPDDMEVDLPKLKKVFPGIPNWSKIKHSNMGEPNRYCDLNLFELHNSCETIIESRRLELITKPLYSFSVNVMCKQVTKEKEEIYIPIELSIYSYSISQGKIDSYHVLIDAGSIPTGFINSTKDHSIKHKITIPGAHPAGYPTGARSDYKKIYKEMLDYAQDGERVLLVAEPRDIPQVKGSIEWLHKKATEAGGKYIGVKGWKILPIADFVTTMYNYIYLKMIPGTTSPIFALSYSIKLKLDSSTLDYNDAIMCDYHKKEDHVSKWCAKSCAIRLITNIEEVLEEMYKLHQLAVRPKSEQKSEVPSLPSSQPERYQPITTPEPVYADDRLELGLDEPPLAIEAPSTSIKDFDFSSYAI